MSIKQIVKYVELKSQLSPEDLAFAERIVSWTETDKEALAGLLRPTKPVKPEKKRVIEKCGDCDYTKRHQIHKVTTMVGFHEFRSARSSPKAGSRRRGMPSSPQPARCVACYEIESHSNHDLDNGGHEFTTDLAKRVNAVLDGATKPDPDDEERCTATREGGRTCNLLLDHNVHQMKTAMGYHEFVWSETAVGVGGD